MWHGTPPSPTWRQLRIDVGFQPGSAILNSSLFSLLSCPNQTLAVRSPTRICRSSLRPRAILDITVPTGTDNTCAISWYFISSTSHSRTTSRYKTGRLSSAACTASRVAEARARDSGVSQVTDIVSSSSGSNSTGQLGAQSSARRQERVAQNSKYPSSEIGARCK